MSKEYCNCYKEFSRNLRALYVLNGWIPLTRLSTAALMHLVICVSYYKFFNIIYSTYNWPTALIFEKVATGSGSPWPQAGCRGTAQPPPQLGVVVTFFMQAPIDNKFEDALEEMSPGIVWILLKKGEAKISEK